MKNTNKITPEFINSVLQVCDDYIGYDPLEEDSARIYELLDEITLMTAPEYGVALDGKILIGGIDRMDAAVKEYQLWVSYQTESPDPTIAQRLSIMAEDCFGVRHLIPREREEFLNLIQNPEPVQLLKAD